MESKWFIIIIALLSFLYRQYKKMNEKREESINDSTNDSNNNQSAALGLDDLIAKFEKKFVTEEEIEVKPEGPFKVVEETKPVVSASTIEISNAQREANEAYSNDDSKSSETKDSETRDSEMDLDLKQIIISQAIINRPEY